MHVMCGAQRTTLRNPLPRFWALTSQAPLPTEPKSPPSTSSFYAYGVCVCVCSKLSNVLTLELTVLASIDIWLLRVCLYLPKACTTGDCHTHPDFTRMLGIQTPILSCTASSQPAPNHLPSLQASLFHVTVAQGLVKYDT